VKTSSKPASSDVFINVPFDGTYERLFLALISGLVGLGLNPRCVLEIPPDQDRLRRLHSIVQACPFSLHDLSRVVLTARGLVAQKRANVSPLGALQTLTRR
jgi:hypothetical protein